MCNLSKTVHLNSTATRNTIVAPRVDYSSANFAIVFDIHGDTTSSGSTCVVVTINSGG